jgi:hypothetical protein
MHPNSKNMPAKERKTPKKDLLPEMAANVWQETSGLPMIIWVSDRHKSKQRSSIKVQTNHNKKPNPDNVAFVTVESDPVIVGGELSSWDFELVKKFIFSNKDLLLKHWDYQIDTKELLNFLVKLDDIAPRAYT